MTSTISRYPRYVGLLLGSATAVGLLWAGAMPANGLAGTDLPARVTFTTASSDLVSVNPAGAFISNQVVAPSLPEQPTGSFTVQNAGESHLDVRMRADASHPTLDPLLQVAIRVGGKRIYSGPLAALRTAGTSSFRLAEDASAQVSVRAWLPTSAGAGYKGRVLDVPLQLRAEVIPR